MIGKPYTTDKKHRLKRKYIVNNAIKDKPERTTAGIYVISGKEVVKEPLGEILQMFIEYVRYILYHAFSPFIMATTTRAAKPSLIINRQSAGNIERTRETAEKKLSVVSVSLSKLSRLPPL